jgi:GNAT superfamily N-acetyltransferase
MVEWLVEPLDSLHERADFSCGKGSLDNFLRALVSQYEKRRLGRTYVAVRSGEKKVLGYFTLASASVVFENLPPKVKKKLPCHPVPVVLLARLAVDQGAQGQGLGRLLLVDALERCLQLLHELGIHAVEVTALDEPAKTFYEKYGFVALGDNSFHLYLPIATIEDIFA